MLKNNYYRKFTDRITSAAVDHAIGPGSFAKAPATSNFVYTQNQNMSPVFHFPFFCLSLLVQLFSFATSLRSFNGLSSERASQKFATLKKLNLPILSDFLRFFESCGVLGYYFEQSKK